MKLNINNKTTLLAAIFTSGLIHAQTIVPAPGVIVEGSASVEGDVRIYEPDTTSSSSTPSGVGAWEALQPTGDNRLTYVYTETSQNEQVQTQINPVLSGAGNLHDDDSTGVSISTNGDVSLHRQTTDTRTANYQVVVRSQKVAPGQTYTDSFGNVFNQGDVILSATGLGVFGAPITETVAVAVTLDTTTVPGTTIVTSLVDLNALPGVGPLVGGELTEAQLDTIRTELAGNPDLLNAIFTDVTGEPEGGNLFVEGDTTVAGNLAVGEVANVEAKLGELDATDADLATSIEEEAVARAEADDALGVRIDEEAVARAEADDALGVRIDEEAVARAAADTAIRGEFAAADTAIRTEFRAADTALGGRIDTETAARISADNLLGGRIDTETAARISQDAAIRSEFAAADTAIRGEFAAADTAIRRDFTTADTAIRQEFAAADANLQSQIDENTRGIAMVAAMTNTRVEAGKTHGVDFNIAQFQDETGFAFGYANRINDNVQLHGAVSSTTDLDESVARVGVAFQW